MAVLRPLGDEEAGAEALAIFTEIRAARQTEFINNFWRVLAHDPALLRATWDRLAVVMGPGTLDPLVKEMIYLAVSAVNGCSY
ncbi:MAG: carboxymuconolactone decarboxylase family protein, partial [Rhodobacteraceae bacterium]|nr:carboxymuconolactone decarboxylase family protein [Paracoccaceae bacterium]